MRQMLCAILLVLPLANLSAAVPADVLNHIRSGNLGWLKENLKDKESLEAVDARGNTPLLWAAALGNSETVAWLLENGANVNTANALGLTPLIAAATEPAKVKLLLAAGADVKAKSKMGQHALVVAAGAPRGAASIAMLLAAGAPVNERGAMGTTPLLAAVGSICSGEAARALMAAGADVKARDGAGFGTAHGALNCAQALVEEFLEKGADVNARNSFGGKVRHGTVDLREITPLMLASSSRNAAMVKMLLDRGADVNARDVRGMTALHFAVSTEDQNVAVAKLLVARGVDLSVKDRNGENAADWARKFNSPPMLAVFGERPSGTVAAKSGPRGPGTLVALQRIEATNESFFKESGCTGCHHASLTSFAAERANKAGLAANPALIGARQARVKGMLGAFAPTFAQQVGPPGDLDSTLYALFDARALGLDRFPEAELAAKYVLSKQSGDGSWTQRGVSRSPMEESDIHRTALAVWLLPIMSSPARAGEATQAVTNGLAWLEKQTARNTDEYAMKLLGLKWGGASTAALQKAAKDLEAAQRADGSWSGNKHLSGDAYSTGFALFALREGAGRPRDAKALKAGAEWLLTRQAPDGTWYVKSRAPKFQPYFESGFPYGQDQWISASATAWAVAGLSEVGAIQ